MATNKGPSSKTILNSKNQLLRREIQKLNEKSYLVPKEFVDKAPGYDLIAGELLKQLRGKLLTTRPT